MTAVGQSALPAELLHAIAHPAGGRVVLVIGAGCSSEAPTSLPLGSELAREVHRKLVADGVLVNGECANPSDLSCIADLVVAKTGQQRELVLRLPRDRFRQAEPNRGHLLAAALLFERALSCVMTLNFDLAMTTALVNVGARGEVSVLAGPQNHGDLGTTNLIYLHRNVDAELEDWVLTSSALANGWRDGWGQVIAQRVIGAPVTVFAGLGSPAAVLVESTQRIRQAIPAQAHVYLVDPGDRAQSAFFASLGLPENAYLRREWVAFMLELAERVVQECRAELENACRSLVAAEGWDNEDVVSLCSRLTQLGLVELGRVRARWILHEGSYRPRSAVPLAWLADLLLGVGLIERVTGAVALFVENGVVEFRREDRIVGVVAIAHGRGERRWLALETEVKQNERHWRQHQPRPRRVLVSGVVGDRHVAVAPPPDTAHPEEAQSIVTGGQAFEMYSVDQLRNSHEIVRGILS